MKDLVHRKVFWEVSIIKDGGDTNAHYRITERLML